MAGADVVDRDPHAEPLQRRDDAARLGQVLQRLALGHFEHDLRQADRRLLEDLAHVLDDLFVGEMPRRQVEADLEMRPPAERRARLLADPPHQRAGQLDDQAARFGERDERRRRHDGAVGLAPADQHLGAAQPARADVDDRLVVGNELAGLERALDLGDRIVARRASASAARAPGSGSRAVRTRPSPSARRSPWLSTTLSRGSDDGRLQARSGSDCRVPLTRSSASAASSGGAPASLDQRAAARGHAGVGGERPAPAWKPWRRTVRTGSARQARSPRRCPAGAAGPSAPGDRRAESPRAARRCRPRRARRRSPCAARAGRRGRSTGCGRPARRSKAP